MFENILIDQKLIWRKGTLNPSWKSAQLQLRRTAFTWQMSLGRFHHSHWNHFSKYFPMSVISLPNFPLVHLIPDWLSRRLCRSLIEQRGPLTAVTPALSCLSQHSASPPLLFLRPIWCNYLIIPAFVPHQPSLAFSSRSPCPSSPLTSPISLTCIPVSPLWRSQFDPRESGPFRGHYGVDDKGGPISPPWVSYITGKQILIIPPSEKEGLCWGERGH